MERAVLYGVMESMLESSGRGSSMGGGQPGLSWRVAGP